MASESSAFCPGHVTAFFEPVEDPDPHKKGSRGVGLSLSLGVKTRVKARLGRKQNVRIYLNREEVPAPTTRWAVERAIGGGGVGGGGRGEGPPPPAPGVGVRGAGAPPAAGDLLWAVLGDPMPKPPLLSDAARLRTFSEVGSRCVREFSKNPSMADLFRLGREFATATGLAQGKVKDAIEAATPYGHCAMAMLGNSIFAMGQVDPLDAIMKGMGAQRYRCKVDQKGARLLTPGGG